MIVSRRLALGTLRIGSPGIHELRSTSAHSWAPEKARLRQPLLIFPARLVLGIPTMQG